MTTTATAGLFTQTFEGTPAGMNLALAQQEIDDTEARYIQDGLVDMPGMVRRRGPVQQAAAVASLTRPATGIVMTLNPAGIDRYAVLNGDGTNGYFSVLSDTAASVASDLAWPHPLPTSPPTTPYRIVDSHPALNGGIMVGVSSAYDANSPNQGIAYWFGGNKANYTQTITVARGSQSVTAASGFSAGVAPGMWLFANTDDPYTNAYIGVVQSVNSDTSITLAQGSPYPVTAKSGTFQSIRGLAPKVVKGRITCDTTSTAVNGGDTKFISQKLSTGSWNLYRASDMTWVGKVASVQSEFALTLAANAAVACADESFIALRADSDYSIQNTANANKVGFLTAVYAERQWFGNLGAQFATTSRVWFSDVSDPEALDLSTFDGDWVDVTSGATVNEPIRALAPAYNALLVLKENETYAIYGAAPSQFTVKKLEDDGALSGMSVQQYGGGVIWCGREGIHFYDGINVVNLVADKLGQYWKDTMRTFDPSKYRMWSMIDRDHYILFVENVTPTVGITKGSVATTPSRLTVVINMATRAVSMLTNVDLRGAVVLPASAGKKIWYVVNDATKGVICDGESLFNTNGVDAFACIGNTAGPDFYFESKKFDAGDALRLKRFRWLAMHFIVQGADIQVDTVLGLNTVGQTSTSTFPASGYTWASLKASVSSWDALKTEFATWSALASSIFVPKRVRFNKKSTHLSFRLYQASSAVTVLKIGPFQLGYKIERAGRVS